MRQQGLEPLTEGFQLQYEHPHGKLFQGDSIDWLKSIEAKSIDLIFADPPYNIKKADWDNFENQEQYIEWSLQWICEASRILKPTGSLYICGFSEILADLKHPASKYFKSCRWLIWHYKNKIQRCPQSQKCRMPSGQPVMGYTEAYSKHCVGRSQETQYCDSVSPKNARFGSAFG